MQTLHLLAGTPEWHAHRAQHFNASDAPSMAGCSPYTTRTELLHRLHSGIAADVDPATQRRFNDGHRFEALARPLAEEIIGDGLAPVVGVLEGTKLSASFDGLTLMGDTAFEHKTLNAELRACMRDEGNGYSLPKHYQVQMEQQLLVSGAERVLFMASEWTGDSALVEERHCWYASDPKLRAEIVAGWAQFEKDLAAYTLPVPSTATPIGRAPESLPALRIELTGAVTASNLAEFKETALGAIRSVNRELTTDAHFADAEQAVKWCGEVESRIKAAKDHALSQTASIDALFRTLDEVSAEARRVQLDLEKIVERRKVEIKGEMVAAAKRAYEAHEAAVRQEAGCWQLFSPPDFAAAIKGKRSVDAMRDALDTALANGKIKVDEAGRKIRTALAALDEESKGFEHLFHDRLAFIGFGPEEVRALVRARITEHRAAEEKRAAELAERERAKIRAEEEARAQRLAQERAAAERAEQESERRRVRAEEESAERAELHRRQQEAEALTAARPGLAIADAIVTAITDNVRPMPTKAPAAPAGPPTLRLGEIQKRIAPLSIDAAGLASLGFPHAKQEGAAKLWQESSFPAICDALICHLTTALNGNKEAA